MSRLLSGSDRDEAEMGLYDKVKLDEQFECKQGHLLAGKVFQTKDIGEWPSMGSYEIKGGCFDGKPGDHGYPPKEWPFSGAFTVYSYCEECQMPDDRNGRWTEFFVVVEAGRVTSVKRIDNAFFSLIQRQ